MRAPLRLAFGEGLLLAIVGVRQVIDTRQHGAERLAVVGEAADRHAAEADAVVAALAADEARALALALRDPVGRRERRDPAGEFEGAWMAELKGRGEVEFGGLLLDRLDDRTAVVAGLWCTN